MNPVPADDDEGLRVVRLSGEIDVATAPGLAEEALGLCAGTPCLALDLTAVEFFDSAGVRLVDRLARECAHRGTGFRVVAPPGSRARRVLELVGMADQLVCDDLAAARVALGAAGG